jgi:hypothetical protein
MRTSLVRLAAGAACLLLLASVALRPAGALADDDEPKPVPPKDAPKDEAKPEVPPQPDVTKLYVPFRDLEKIFQKEGQGVFLPYKEFRRLWELAHKLPPDTSKPPVPATVRSAAYTGTVEGDTIRFEAQVDVEVLEDGWQRIPLDFAGIGIEKAEIGGQPALLVPTKRGYDLLLQGAGRRTLDLVLRAAAPAKGDTHTAQFSVPPVPLARLALTVPGTDTQVTITPRLASTTKSEGGQTQLLAFLGPVAKVSVGWKRKPEDVPTVNPLVFSEETLDVRVDRGVVRSTLRAALSIRRAPLRVLTVVVPREAVVLYVNGDGIRTWTRNEAGDRLRVELRAPVKTKYALQVGLEHALPPPPVTPPLPLAFLDGMERERGFLRVEAADGVKIEPRKSTGLVQIDLHDLPKELQGATPGRAYGFRFPARPGEVVFDVQALEPRLSACMGTRLGIRPEGLDVLVLAQVTVERAGLFALDFDVPADLDVNDVQIKGAELDDWTLQRQDGKPSLLHVALRDRLLGHAQVRVQGRSALEIPEAEGAPAVVRAMPLMKLRGAHHVRGYVAVHVAPALDHSVKESRGLTPLDANAPAACEPPPLVGEAASLPLVYRYEHREGDIALTYELKRKAPTVTCQVETWVRLEPGKTRMGAVLRYHVAFRGVRAFRFRAPLALGKRLHLEDPELELLGPTEEPAEAGHPAVRGLWTVKLPAARTGDVTVNLVLDDQPEAELASGGARETAIPSFVPLTAEDKPLPNVVSHVAVRRDPLLEVRMTEGLKGEEIDSRELPPGLRDEGNFLAFRSYSPDYKLTVRVTKHDYEPVADLVVSHMHLDTVVPAEGRATTEAFLVVRNNGRQHLEIRLPPGSTIRAVRVAGKSESPRKGEDGAVRIPLLANMRQDKAFLVALYYDHDVERGGALFDDVRLVSPVPVDVKSDVLTWRVFVPEGRRYTSFGGTMQRVGARGSWAARALRSVTSILESRDGATPLDVRALIDSYKSPFTQRTHASPHFDFQGRVGTGSVVITSTSSSFFLFWKLLWFAIALALSTAVVRPCVRLGLGRGVAFLVPLLIVVALLIPAGPGATEVETAMLVGVLLSGLISFGAWFRTQGRSAPPPAPAPTPAPGEGGAA